jgi:uncharacterized protein involved in type VI secretion and phage assembly
VSDDTALLPRVYLGGKPLSDDQLRSVIEVRVERALNLPGRCLLRFAATSPLQLAKVDDAVEVTAPDGTTLAFKGTVVALELEHQSEAMPVATVIAYDAAHQLADWSGTATYLEQDAGQILNRIGKRHQLDISTQGVKGSYEYLAQAGSDLEMVDVLAARCGADWWFDEGVLRVEVLKADGPSAAKVPLAQLERFSVRASADRPDELSVVGWSSTDQKPLLGKATYESGMLSSTAALVEQVASGSKAKQPARTGNVPVASKDEADALATSMLRASVRSTTRVEGVGRNLWTIGPGDRLEITDAKGLDVDGKYLLSEVEHRYDPVNGSTTRFACGSTRPAALVDVLDGGDRSPLSHGGLLVGEVTNINDPRKEGRVKVRFLGLDDQEESNWARVLIPGAGDKRGSVVLPEVKDEVLVGFEGGDLRKPIVLGGMFGSKSKIPVWTVKDGKVAARRTTSRSGHFIELGDGTSDKEKHVQIQLSDGQTKLRLGLDESLLNIPSGKKLTIKVGNSSIVLDGKGKIEISCMDLVISATNEVKIKGNRGIEAKGGMTASLQAPKLEIKGNATADIDGGGALTLKGGMVKIN